jgi:TP901 family phage tail tape measure protein
VARRVQLDIDLNVESITGLPGTPGTPSPPSGGGGDNVITGVGNVAGLAGMFAMRRSLLSLGNLLPAGMSVPAVMAIVAAVGVLVAGFVALKFEISLVVKIAKAFGTALLVSARLGAQAVAALVGWYVRLAQTITGLTVRAVQWLGEQTVYWARRGAEALAGMVRTGVAAYAELQQSAANTATVIGKFGAAAMAARAEVEEYALTMSSSMRYTAQEVADAMYQVYSYGFTAKGEVEAVTTAALNLASATLYGVESTTAMMAAVLSAFKLSGDQAGAVADILFNAVRYSAAEMSKLVESMRFAAPAAAMFGLSLKDTVAVLEGFYRVGLQGSMAGTYFRQMLVSLTRATPVAAKAFAAFGANIKDFSVLKLGSPIAVLEKMQELMKRIGKANFTQMIVNAFGTRGSFGIMSAMAASVEQIKEYRKQLDESGTTSKAAADQLNTLAGAWQLLKNNLQNLETLVIRGPVAQWFMAFVGVLRQLIETARQSGAIGALQGVLINLVAGFGALLRYLGPTAIGAIRDILLSLGAAIWQMFQGAVKILPSVIGFLQWLPRLFAYAFAQLVPMLVRFGQAFIPLLLQIAGIVLPMLVQALAGVGNFLAAFLEQNSGQIVLWFQWFAWGILQVVAALPQLLPMLASIVNAFVYLAPLIINAAVQGIPALIAAAQALLPWLIALAYRGVAVLLLFMEYFRTHLSSHMIPTVKTFLGTIMRVLDFIITKWPQITKLLVTMAWAAYALAKAMDSTLAQSLQKVGEWLDYFATNGRDALLGIIAAMRELIALLALKLSLDALDMYLKVLDKWWLALAAGKWKEWEEVLGMLAQMMFSDIPAAAMRAQKALRDTEGEVKKNMPGPDGRQAMLAPPPGLEPVGYNPQGSNQMVQIDARTDKETIRVVLRGEIKELVRYQNVGGPATGLA